MQTEPSVAALTCRGLRGAATENIIQSFRVAGVEKDSGSGLKYVLRHWLFRGTVIMSAALAIEAAAQFGRSMALTRLLNATEFGIVAAMVALLTTIDMGTFVAADRYLVQADDGDTPDLLAVAHTLAISRNLLCCFILLVFAYPTTRILHVPQALDSFLCLAIVPLVRTFEHHRLEQLQREHRFLPWASASSFTNITGLGVSVIAAALLHDHRAVLWGLICQTAVLVTATHAIAGVPYRAIFTAAPIARALRFGAPLMVNGLALAALGQLDRLAVGTFMGVAALGQYGLATMTFYVPTALSMRVMVAVLQPRLSSTWHRSPDRGFPILFAKVNAGIAILATLVSSAVAIVGGPLFLGLFGARYAIDDSFFCVFAAALFFRYAKASLNFGGLSMGRTIDLMWSNLCLVFGLAVTVLGLVFFHSFLVAAVGCFTGELCGAAGAFILLRGHLRLANTSLCLPFFATLPLLLASDVWVLLERPTVAIRGCAVVILAISIIISVLCYYFRPPILQRSR